MAGNTPNQKKIFINSLLVLGNVLGVGVLALPISAGLGGFFPALIGIIAIWFIMLFSAWLIVYRMDNNTHHDMPSFYKRELGTTAKWLAIICNLIILYGVLVAYLSGIAIMVSSLFTGLIHHKAIIICIYFCLGVCTIVFGLKILRKGMIAIILVIWVSFFVMVGTSITHFHGTYLTFNSWKYFPACLALAVSSFHFHNIIPTVFKGLNFDKKATCKAIFVGVFIGLIINLVWITMVLASVPVFGGTNTIVYAGAHNLTANVPLCHILKSEVFNVFGLIFGIFAVTSSFVTNGAGLWGYIDDMLFSYFKKNNPLLVSVITFLPVITIALLYPKIFVTALSIVGGIGEDILFGILPAIVILRISKNTSKYATILKTVGWYMLIMCTFVLCYVLYQKI